MFWRSARFAARTARALRVRRESRRVLRVHSAPGSRAQPTRPRCAPWPPRARLPRAGVSSAAIAMSPEPLVSPISRSKGQSAELKGRQAWLGKLVHRFHPFGGSPFASWHPSQAHLRCGGPLPCAQDAAIRAPRHIFITHSYMVRLYCIFILHNSVGARRPAGRAPSRDARRRRHSAQPRQQAASKPGGVAAAQWTTIGSQAAPRQEAGASPARRQVAR